MNKFKITCLGLSMLLVASSLCGCSEKENSDQLLDPKNPVTVTVWHYYNGVQQTTFDEMVNNFNDTVGHEKGVVVEAYSKSSINELADSVIASVNKEAGAETPPSIFAAYAETTYKLDKMGTIADLNQYITDKEKDEYIKEYINEGIFSDGSMKIFPTAKSTEVMMINKTDWDKFSAAENVSESDLSTMEGIAETAEKYYEYTDALTPDIPNDGKAFFGRDSVANYMYIGAKQLGCEYFEIDKDGNASITIKKDVLKKLWENYYVPYVKGYYTAQSRYRSDDAKIGSLIALICSTSGAAYFPSEVTIDNDYTYPIENKVLEVPCFADSEKYFVQQGAGMSVIKSDKKTEYASMLFLKWFTEEERNIEFSISSGYLPVKKSANNYNKVSEVNEKLEAPMDDTMLNTIKTAIGEIDSKSLYTSTPFDKSTEARDYIGNTMQNTAADDYAAAWERISAGEDRDSVLNEYVSDEAFDKWYESFIGGLEKTIS